MLSRRWSTESWPLSVVALHYFCPKPKAAKCRIRSSRVKNYRSRPKTSRCGRSECPTFNKIRCCNHHFWYVRSPPSPKPTLESNLLLLQFTSSPTPGISISLCLKTVECLNLIKKKSHPTKSLSKIEKSVHEKRLRLDGLESWRHVLEQQEKNYEIRFGQFQRREKEEVYPPAKRPTKLFINFQREVVRQQEKGGWLARQLNFAPFS